MPSLALQRLLACPHGEITLVPGKTGKISA